MTGRRLLDTNLIVRYLVQDHEKHARAAGKLFAACDRGELTLVILPVVLAECVFVLESFYEHPRPDIARVLINLLDCPGVELLHPAVHRDALARYARTSLHFVDCLIAAHAAAGGTAVATFDAGFKKFPDIRISET